MRPGSKRLRKEYLEDYAGVRWLVGGVDVSHDRSSIRHRSPGRRGCVIAGRRNRCFAVAAFVKHREEVRTLQQEAEDQQVLSD